MISTQNRLFDNGKRGLIIIFITFLLIYLIGYLIYPYSKFWSSYFERNLVEITVEWILSFLYCFLVFEINIVLSKKINLWISWHTLTEKRFYVETMCNLAVTFVLSMLIFLWFNTSSNIEQYQPTRLLNTEETIRIKMQLIIGNVVSSSVILGITIKNYFFSWKYEVLHSSQSNLVAMEAELQALKLQVDPHFVFNSLSVLSELILEDQQLGYDYSENFAKIYRYLLLNSKGYIVTLDKEMKFINSYIFLIKQRMGKSVIFNIDVDPKLNIYKLPPLTLHLLVENALKHNKATKSNILKINIYSVEPGELIVENNFEPIENNIVASGIGLKNLICRYNLLSDREPHIVQQNNMFKVIIPLLMN